MTHPFIAKKAWQATKVAQKASERQMKNPELDGLKSGGQVDAFRHTFWMALLVREMKMKKALKLGEAHEKSNYLDFKKNRKEDGTFPDKASKEMDLFNNKKGAEIGIRYTNIHPDSLKNIIIDSILAGKLRIIYRDSALNFLDCSGKIISTDRLKGEMG